MNMLFELFLFRSFFMISDVFTKLFQVIVGSIGLVYTAKYYPLRFHLCRMLTRLSAECGRFVPVLPHYLEVLDTHNFNKKTTKV